MSRKTLAALAFILAFLAAESTHAQATRTYKIINGSGNTITAVYISPRNTDQWGKNILNIHEVENGQSFLFTASTPLNNCNMDVKFVGTENKSYILRNVDLCKATGVNLTIPVYKAKNNIKNQTIERAREGK